MKTLLKVRGTLTPSCSRSHVNYVFHLDKDIKTMNISFSYSPKFLDDDVKARHLIEDHLSEYGASDSDKKNWKTNLPLKNLLTLSLDGPNGFKGAAHRQDKEQELTIGEKSASDGLKTGKLEKGKWTVTISAHWVATDECSYQLHMWEVNN